MPITLKIERDPSQRWIMGGTFYNHNLPHKQTKSSRSSFYVTKQKATGEKSGFALSQNVSK